MRYISCRYVVLEYNRETEEVTVAGVFLQEDSAKEWCKENGFAFTDDGRMVMTRVFRIHMSTQYKTEEEYAQQEIYNGQA